MNVNRTVARVLLPILLLLGLAYFFATNNSKMFRGDSQKELNISQFMTAIGNNNVLDGNFDKDTFQGHLTQNGGRTAFSVYLGPENPFQRQALSDQLISHGVKNFGYTRPPISDNVMAMLLSVVLPLGVIFVFCLFITQKSRPQIRLFFGFKRW